MGEFENSISAGAVLITGGAGFLGSNLALRLDGLRRIRILDNFTRNSLVHMEPDALRSVEILRGDVRDSATLQAALADMDIVVHLAAMAGVSNYYRYPLDVMQVNLGGTLALLLALESRRVRRLVFLSTSEVYGAQAKDAREDQPLPTGELGEMRWTYALSKISAEKACIAFARQTGTPVVILRPFNIFGRGQTGEGAVHDMIRTALAGRPVTVHGDGLQVRAWCHVDDFVDAAIAAMDVPGLNETVMNIGNPGNAMTILELAEKVIAAVGKHTSIRHEPHFGLDIACRTPDISRMRTILGISPRVAFEDGLPPTVEWYRRHDA